MLKALGRLLNSAGFMVEKFSNPPTFFRARATGVSCGRLDVWMPDMNGLEVHDLPPA